MDDLFEDAPSDSGSSDSGLSDNGSSDSESPDITNGQLITLRHEIQVSKDQLEEIRMYTEAAVTDGEHKRSRIETEIENKQTIIVDLDDRLNTANDSVRVIEAELAILRTQKAEIVGEIMNDCELQLVEMKAHADMLTHQRNELIVLIEAAASAQHKCIVCRITPIEVASIPCGHVFCECCFQRCFRRPVKLCAMCRQPVVASITLHI
jgi:hypothetical protein